MIANPQARRGLSEWRSTPLTNIAYVLEPDLSPAEFIDVLVRSSLSQRRPVDQAERIAGMLAKADIVVTARCDGKLIGISRAITDFHFCTYLSDLAVDEAFQHKGVGKELIRQTHVAAGLQTTLVLLAAPNAVGYYPKVGMRKHESCWVIDRES
jgi:ribosomal protein S18 acetylase RimI-like enzyme